MKKRLLAIDIGNTNITLGLFRGAKLVKKTKVQTARPDQYSRRIRAFLSGGHYDAIISSVVPKALVPVKRCLVKMGAHRISVLGENIKVPIKNLYAKPKQVGQDRLVNAYAARELYGEPVVVIDFGTAVTFDCVSKKGEYLGGLIMPGIELSIQSLYEKTALLPKITLRPTKNLIGRSTEESMRAGILFGLGAACDGLITKYSKILGRPLLVIATGGSSALIKRYARSIQITDEDITLKGLMLMGIIFYDKT